MGKHKCKLCFKNFSNGRDLGGHMREHEHHHHHQLSFEIETEPALSLSSSEDDELDEEKSLFYGSREKPKRGIRLVDPFSFAVVDAAASVVLQDRESETESSKNPTRRRSKRTRKLEQQEQKLKFNNNTTTEPSWDHEPEPVSSISDTTTEEDVAFCLMMLSRDKWKRKGKQQQQHGLMFDEDKEKETDEAGEFKSFNKNPSRGKYKCETCKKVFKSYQALGGHRASHKKIKFYTPVQETKLNQENAGAFTAATAPTLDKKVHKCPVCFRVFSSGQALGGHKRTHVTGLVALTATATAAGSTSARNASASTKLGEIMIDLNLPAPIDDDDISQIELSAVSDAEFLSHINR